MRWRPTTNAISAPPSCQLLPGLVGGGSPRQVDLRDVVNAILCVIRTGCSWRQLPHDFFVWQTVYGYFPRWRKHGTATQPHEALRDPVRGMDGRQSAPTAGIIDAQSLRGASTVGYESRGYDAGKKVNGRKRHIVVDTMGMLLAIVVTPASAQDHDGGKLALILLRSAFGSVTRIWADGGYAGKLVIWAHATFNITLDIVKRNDDLSGFVVVPHPWVVERTFSWLIACRRLGWDYERLPETHVTAVQ